MKPFQIEDRVINSQRPPFIIAESGINHEGSLEKAIQLVDAAAATGADCIKFQCHIPEAEMIPTDMTPGNISKDKLWDIIVRCSLTEGEERKIQAYCKKKKILYLSTPFSREAADRLYGMKVPAFKIGSGECNNYPLLQYIAKMGKPILLSTGMNHLSSIKKSVEIFRKYRCPLLLFHCTSLYPTPYNKLRLGILTELKKKFGLPVGLSDHTHGIYTALAGVALGAVAIEKHFTVTREWPGPDIPFSIEPEELRQLVLGSQAIFEALGGKKTILSEEQPIIDFAYASVVTLTDIIPGEAFTEKNIWVKRPGTGKILAEDLHKVLGKKSKRAIKSNQFVSPADILGW